MTLWIRIQINSGTVSGTGLYAIRINTVKKAERDAGQKHEGGVKFHHPRRTNEHQRLGLSVYMGDGISRHHCVVVLRHDWLF
jgi:hypothetical protein